MVSAGADPVVVLGAGLTGLCTALGLARKGRRVALIDQAPGCLLRASLRNEGKIHLGLVYANDPSERTPGLMLEGALRFDRAVEELVGRPVDWRALRSKAFVYVVLDGSLRTPDELAREYAGVQARYDEVAADGVTYLGTRPGALWKVLPERAAAEWLAPGVGRAMFATAELALDTERFCHLMRGALTGSDRVEQRFGHRVDTVDQTSAGYRLEGRTLDGEPWSLRAGVVVNCLWEDRLRLDRQLGLAPLRPWVHRLRYRLAGNLPATLANLPSFTFVLGPFGDVVTWPSGRVYLSWYPTCMGGWSTDLQVPQSWEGPCAGRVSAPIGRRVTADALRALDRIIPGLGVTGIDTIDAGVITAWGTSDVDDPASGLHQRHDVGPQAHDGWISVDTGKLTTAPLFAERAVALADKAAR